jgi:site-specific DNA recombinase
MQTTATRRAAIYARISQDRDGSMLGVERQRADCQRVIEARGWDLAGLYVDNDLSAYSGKQRPEYLRLLDDLKARRIDAVVAWHPDRLHRSPRELEDFVDAVEAAGAAVETATAGALDLSTPSGRMAARMLGAAARYESEHKAERIRRKHLEMAERGQPLRGGSRAFGLTADWTGVVPHEADLIREAVARVLAGASLRSIAADWNARGVVTSTGGRWQQQPLRRMLTSWRLAGIREHRGERAGAGTWPAIVDLETLERVRAVLRDPSRRTTGHVRPRRYLLTGMLDCGLCHRPLRSRPRNDGVRRYACASGPMFGGCGKLVILAEPLEELVAAAMLEALDTPDFGAAMRTADESGAAGALDELRTDREALEQLARDHYADRIIGRAEYLAARDAVELRIADHERAVAAAAGSAAVAALAGDARDRWDTIDFDARRGALVAIIDRVVVGPGRRGYNRFDASRVAITWRA